MLRPILTLLLLLNYLLVVGAGVLVGQPPASRYSAAHPYVHSAECQQHHYLRLDCFEHCNGDQRSTQSAPRRSAPHLLALLKGLDEHCPVAAPAVALQLVASTYRVAASYPAPRLRELTPGFAGRDPRPPQRA